MVLLLVGSLGITSLMTISYLVGYWFGRTDNLRETNISLCSHGRDWDDCPDCRH